MRKHTLFGAIAALTELEKMKNLVIKQGIKFEGT